MIDLHQTLIEPDELVSLISKDTGASKEQVRTTLNYLESAIPAYITQDNFETVIYTLQFFISDDSILQYTEMLIDGSTIKYTLGPDLVLVVSKDPTQDVPLLTSALLLRPSTGRSDYLDNAFLINNETAINEDDEILITSSEIFPSLKKLCGDNETITVKDGYIHFFP